ncbi:MAG: ABC transporter permease [Vicinamibacterales bacterium]
MFEAVIKDVRYALRWLARSPGFALVAILSLGLGIGFNTAIFAVVDALLLRPLPVRNPGQLIEIYTSSPDGDRYATASVPDYQDLAARAEGLEGIVGYSPMFAAVNAGSRARLTMGEVVTGNYFQVLGVRTVVGRGVLPADDVAGAPPVVVLSYAYWQREFGGDPAAVGRTLTIQGRRYDIVGVTAAGYSGLVPLLAPEVFLPVAHVEDVEPAGIQTVVPSPTGTTRLDRRGQRWLFLKGRLQPGTTIEQARANLDVIAAQLEREHPVTNEGRRLSVLPTSAVRLHPDADGLVSWGVGGTMFAVGLVLLIACANVAGMLLARASARQKEISLRMAIGASRRRLVQQLLTESVVLGGLGAASGVALAWWLTRAMAGISLPIPVPLAVDIRLDWRVLGFSALAAVATGIVAGLVPALRASRPALVPDLKGDAPAARVGRRRVQLRDALVAGQVAVTVLLLVSAGLLARSLSASRAAAVGFPADGLALVGLDMGMAGYDDAAAERFYEDVQRRLAALPGVVSVARASRFPFSVNFNRSNFAFPGRQQSPDEIGPSIDSADVSPSYFDTLGVGVLQGRGFAGTDTRESPLVAVVNQAFARTYFPDRGAVGETMYLRTLASGRPIEIVGVVADHATHRIGEGAVPVVYRATTQTQSAYGVLAARTRGDAQGLLVEMRRVVLAMEPNALFLDNQTMPEQIAATLFPVRAAATLVGVFSGIGLLLAAIGLYGVIAFAVSRRTREIGVRMAIGARPRDVLGMMMRQGLGIALAGAAAGLVLAAIASRAVAGALYGVGVADPVAWGGSLAVLALIAGLANLIPAWRAMRIDPARALRAE